MTRTITLIGYGVLNDYDRRPIHITEAAARRMATEPIHRPPFERRVTLAVGDAVSVRAYGRVRTGRVKRLGRTRVWVQYLRNLQGDLDERWFTVDEIYSGGHEVRHEITHEEE